MTRRRPSSELRATTATPDEQGVFDDEVATHHRVERRLVWKEIAAIVIVGSFVIVRQLWLD